MSGGSSQSLALKVVSAESVRQPKEKTVKKPAKKPATKAVKTVPKKAVQKPAAVKTAPKSKKKTPLKKASPKATLELTRKRTSAKKRTKKSTSPRSGLGKKSSEKKAPSKKGVHKKEVTFGTRKSFKLLKRDPLGHLLVEKKLREGGFKGVVTSDRLILDAYSTDESIFSIRPQIVLQPEDVADIEAAVEVIATETKNFSSLSLTPRAAGTGLSGGSLTDSIVIDVAVNMQHIGEPVTKKGMTTITCQPGANFSDVEKKLKKKGVYIPSAPASKDICSIGGAVANNAAGPDSLKHGHMADWIESLDVVLHDGKTYTVEPLTYKAYTALTKKKNALATIAREVFMLIEKNEKGIHEAKPATKKNTAGYPLWNVLDTSIKEFKNGNGTFDLTQLFAGSQGTIGVITSVTLRTEPIDTETTLIMLPIFDLDCAGRAILQALKYDPINIEVFDALSFDLALQNPDFFKERITGLSFYKVMYTLYTTYHLKYRRKIPDFTLLITLDKDAFKGRTKKELVAELQSCGCNIVRFVKSPEEREMWWQVRRASYTLSKMQDNTKRPAAFLEDMTVPPQNLFGFFADIKKLFKKYDIKAAVHGHGGNGHFHFYPLLDFNNSDTPELIERMSEEFFDTATKYGGSLCGEHNDGIIRTPHLSKMYKKPILKLFEVVEHLCDPDDIFNPGKKVNPRFDIKDSIRRTN